LLEKSLTIVL